MAKKIFIWVAHPRAGSLCEGLSKAYQTAAQEAGAECRVQLLSDMSFETGFAGYGHDTASLEPDLVAWQENITWADHLLFAHPYWWAGLPGQAKAVLDRALLPGFGFKYRPKGALWDKLLTGRTGDVIITSDTPPWFDTLIYGHPGRRVMKNQIMGFCGVKAKTIKQFGTVKTASPEKIARWLDTAARMGTRAARA